MTMAALRCEECVGRTMTLAGPKAYTTKEVIEMCETMSDSKVGEHPGVAVWGVGVRHQGFWLGQHMRECRRRCDRSRGIVMVSRPQGS